MGLQARLLRCIKELLLLPADLTLGEICRYELKHGFVHELTGLETRPTRAFCNVWVKTPFHWHGASGERSFPRLNQQAPSWQAAQAKSNTRTTVDCQNIGHHSDAGQVLKTTGHR